MQIWEYKSIVSIDGAPPPLRDWHGREGWNVFICPYCQSSLHTIGRKCLVAMGPIYAQLDVCSNCGWWMVSRRGDNYRTSEGEILLYRAWGELKELDLSDVSTPISELRTYLIAKYDERFNVHPKKYEEIVASVFADFGYKAKATSYSGDEGIDIFIFDGDEDLIGIQVKRYKGKIEAEQIRSFAGALILNGLTKGIFVTSGYYRSGAVKTAQRYHDRGLSITLQDANDFYDRLEILQRPQYYDYDRDDPTTPFYSFCQNPMIIPYLSTYAW